MTTQPLALVINEILSEKRLQFRSKKNFEINLEDAHEASQLFSQIQLVEMQRLLSNLINNSAEAMDHSGKISVELGCDHESIIINVKDNGKGIPHEILKNLGQRGKTYGKKKGNGLGLYHARKTIEHWNGTLKIESETGKGTEVIIRLPKVAPPKWFVNEIKLAEATTIVVVDDDPSIHGVWNTVFSSYLTAAHLQIIHFNSTQELEKWLPENRHQHLLFFIDYEFLCEETNGLNLIEKLGIAQQSFLVTSHYSDEEIKSRCEKSGVALIPKCLAGSIKIRLEQKGEFFDAVLIDGDGLTHMSWKLSAKYSNKTIQCFASAEDFFNQCDNIDKKTRVFIDDDLGNDVKGIAVAEAIFKKGFKELYLSTAYPLDHFPHVPWIREIIGKVPPWCDLTGA